MKGAAARVVRIERHPLGPRLFVLGKRLHECHAGLALFVAWLVAAAVDAPVPHAAGVGTALLGAWLVVKDWRDLFPSTRDTAAWSVAPHRRPAALRASRRGDWVPGLLGLLAAAVGAMNLASTLTPDAAARARALRDLGTAPMGAIAHALAVPVSLGVLLLGVHIARRHRRAWTVAVVALPLLGLLDIAKGLDIEEALATWALAALLIWARQAFYVRPAPRTLWRVGRRVAAAALAGYVTAIVVVAAGHEQLGPNLTPRAAFGEAAGLLTMTGGTVPLPPGRHWLVALPGLVGAAVLVFASALLFRPVRAPRDPAPEALVRARSVVERHRSDTLSFFKLRSDVQRLFDPDGVAFVAYRVESRVMVISGDPVGPAEALPGLVRHVFAFAEAHGLRVTIVGAGEALLPLYADAGLRSVYIGDEAIVETSTFTLEGRAIRKVRQSVTRLSRAGYRTECRPVAGLAESELAELEAVSSRWRGAAPERGFSMAMEGLRGESSRGSLVVVARDPEGRVRGFLQFVPCYGRAAMSLSMMRRDHDTPNGLTEFLVVAAIGGLRERGVADVSLNFAVAGRYLRRPARGAGRVLRPAIRAADRWFQIESLHRFNAKFLPSWQPRHLLFEGALAFPASAIAALRAEGQIPWPGGRAAAGAPVGVPAVGGAARA